MTRNQQWLLDSAREALVYLTKKEKGEPTIGMYDPIWIGRMLRYSIEAVEVENALGTPVEPDVRVNATP